MTKREVENLKKEYQWKCREVKRARKRCVELQLHPGCDTVLLEAEAERFGCLHAAMALLETGKQQGSSRPLINQWEAEVNFDSRAKI